MQQHRTFAIAALTALALAVVSPASALAQAKTVKGTGSETVRIDPETGAFSGDISGVASHLGKVTGEIEGVGALTPDGTFAGSGSVTITTASGDELTGTFTIATSASGSGTEAIVVVTITGGTGRFADASGTLTVICQAPAPAPVGSLLVSTGDCRLTGSVDP